MENETKIVKTSTKFSKIVDLTLEESDTDDSNRTQKPKEHEYRGQPHLNEVVSNFQSGLIPLESLLNISLNAKDDNDEICFDQNFKRKRLKMELEKDKPSERGIHERFKMDLISRIAKANLEVKAQNAMESNEDKFGIVQGEIEPEEEEGFPKTKEITLDFPDFNQQNTKCFEKSEMPCKKSGEKGKNKMNIMSIIDQIDFNISLKDLDSMQVLDDLEIENKYTEDDSEFIEFMRRRRRKAGKLEIVEFKDEDMNTYRNLQTCIAKSHFQKILQICPIKWKKMLKVYLRECYISDIYNRKVANKKLLLNRRSKLLSAIDNPFELDYDCNFDNNMMKNFCTGFINYFQKNHEDLQRKIGLPENVFKRDDN